MTSLLRLVVAVVLVFPCLAYAGGPEVTAVRCPEGGVQPQAAVDGAGKVHLIYLAGDDARSDVRYTTSGDGGRTWAGSIRVNSNPGSAIAVGTVRGAQLALGKGGRPHVAWMGAQGAEPRGPGGATPMLYARLNDGGDAFEAQRNLITTAPGLDGGGSIVADGKGNVIVAWHAPIPGLKGEENRTVWVTASGDDGKTFKPEWRLSDDPTGACGCCGMRLALDASGDLLGLYRAANATTRDVYLLHLGRGANNRFEATKVHELVTKTCPMSTMAFATSRETTLAAWETGGQVYFTRWDSGAKKAGEPIAPAGKASNRKHPSMAMNKDGMALLAWTEGTGWKRGGGLAWQVYDGSLAPVSGVSETVKDLPAWSLPTAVAKADGSFLIVY
jgi:hypothetical protein